MTPVYGARLTDHTPPNGAYYATEGAPLDGPGTLQRPCGNPVRLLNEAPAGATVVLDGVFPASLVQQWRRPVTLQVAPGKSAVLIGSDPAHEWVPEGGLWWHNGPAFDHTPNGDILDSARPWASWPEQVWMDGEPLTMVGPGMDVGPGEFSVTAGGVLWVGEDPTEHDMRIAVRRTAFTGSLDMQTGVHPPAILLGVEAWHQATESRDRAAIKVYGESHLEDVTVGDCSAAGISIMRSQGGSVRNCTVTGAGQLGIHGYLADDLDLGWNLIGRANRRGFRYTGEAGAVKLFQSVRALAHHNRLLHNDGHGLWWDGDSDDGVFWRNDITDTRTGIFYELCANGHIYGNRAEDCIVGVLLSGARDTTVTHNTAVNNDADIRDQADQRRADMRHSNVFEANAVTHGSGPGASPTLYAAGLLELSVEETGQPHVGWYGPVYTPPEPPPTEPPMPYDTDPLDQSVGDLTSHVAAAIAEIRRLEDLIANDDDDAVIAALQAQVTQLQADLFSTAVALMGSAQQVNVLTATVNSQQATITGLGNLVSTQNDVINTLTQERDAALQTIAIHVQSIAAQHVTILDQQATIAVQLGQIEDLTLALAECEAQHEPEPLPVLVGGTHKNGYVTGLKGMLGEAPMAWRRYSGGARFSTADLDSLALAHADGATLFVSPQEGTNDDTNWNIDQLITRMPELVTGHLVWMNKHEPTQKMTGPAFVSMVHSAYSIVRDVMPQWDRIITLMAFDFEDPNAARHPDQYLAGLDFDLITGLGIDVYDKGNADGAGDGKFLAELMDKVEPWAVAHELPIFICETSAPDQGQKPGTPPVSNPRRALWKADWITDAWDHVNNTTVGPDEVRLYRSLIGFNSDVGPDSPAAVVGPPAVKAGWYWDTTPEALAAFVDVLHAAKLEAQG